jgi:hypothetical protein
MMVETVGATAEGIGWGEAGRETGLVAGRTSSVEPLGTGGATEGKLSLISSPSSSLANPGPPTLSMMLSPSSMTTSGWLASFDGTRCSSCVVSPVHALPIDSSSTPVAAEPLIDWRFGVVSGDAFIPDTGRLSGTLPRFFDSSITIINLLISAGIPIFPKNCKCELWAIRNALHDNPVFRCLKKVLKGQSLKPQKRKGIIERTHFLELLNL